MLLYHQRTLTVSPATIQVIILLLDRPRDLPVTNSVNFYCVISPIFKKFVLYVSQIQYFNVSEKYFVNFIQQIRKDEISSINFITEYTGIAL
jgi:hypothetical protein